MVDKFFFYFQVDYIGKIIVNYEGEFESSQEIRKTIEMTIHKPKEDMT